MAYKKDQGRMARMAVFWFLAVLLFYGCLSLYRELFGRVDALAQNLAGRVPVLGLDINGALLVTAAVFCGILLLIYRYTERPRTADLLIETESELKKVTWPTVDEAFKSSIVVVLTVAFLMAFLAFSDALLGRVARVILMGGS
ncbi:MAG: preprotein translocase subunit SecE [Planctomycetota bacterium]|jgi:preprotein translocase SecE subunit|nr:preprotein translocase subunit SecE [Planctomycetota bacterium]MDP6990083.1 preprotein translocase subunit SecE [Planctomycetota bacterium]